MYSPEVYAKVNALYERKRAKARQTFDEHFEKARKLPGMEPIIERLASTGVRILQAMRTGGMPALEKVRKENEELLRQQKEILKAHGLPADYCEIHYDCSQCSDTGFLENGKRCSCMNQAFFEAQAECSGLGALVRKQNFDNFSAAYYPDPKHAQALKEQLRGYAADCVKSGRNLLLLGGTGLGKTHLSTAISVEVMRAGNSVAYESAPNLLADFLFERYGRGYGNDSPSRTARYFGSDLLIIDDLGSEGVNDFAISVIYNLINTRLNNARATVINTNLSAQELLRTYGQRVYSRLIGEFRVVALEGSDVRLQKLGG